MKKEIKDFITEMLKDERTKENPAMVTAIAGLLDTLIKYER